MTNAKKYSYSFGSFSVSADVVGRVIEEIEEKDGSVTKESFLNASRPIESPTHDLFEWDDAIAAEKFRLRQSRRVIDHICVEVDVAHVGNDGIGKRTFDVPIGGSRKSCVRAFVNTEECSGTRAGKFRSFEKAMSNHEMRRVVVANALREFNQVLSKYKFLKEFEPIAESVAQVEAENNKRKE